MYIHTNIFSPAYISSFNYDIQRYLHYSYDIFVVSTRHFCIFTHTITNIQTYAHTYTFNYRNFRVNSAICHM